MSLRGIDPPTRANLREVGGFRTRDGATVASGRLYRGAELCALDPAISAHLVDVLGIQRVIDLRMEGEGGDAGALPPGCERHRVPLFETVQPHWPDPVARTPAATSQRYYEMLVIGRQALGRIVVMLAEEPAWPTLVHCVAGRDRTGIVVACLLDLLGVPEEIIAADYALSEVMNDPQGRNADPDNILRLLEMVRAEHGSTEEMLLDVGVPQDAIDGLRKALLAD